MIPRIFIFEGLDGCGKTTQCQNLKNYLNDIDESYRLDDVQVYKSNFDENHFIGLDMENSLYYEKTKSIKDKLDKLGRKKFFLTYLYQKKKTIKLQIYNGKNILERVHLLFASYHKKTYSEGGNQYIDISYYSFDEENIIRNILSLGLLVKVVEPNYIRKRILELLEKGRELDSLQMVKIYDK